MDKRTATRLQRLIDKTSAASNEFTKWNEKLCDFCREHYGHEPGDIDADEIIDSVQGGSGSATGMNAEEFDKIMRQSD